MGDSDFTHAEEETGSPFDAGCRTRFLNPEMPRINRCIWHGSFFDEPMSYSVGFTAASLRPELLRAIVEIRVEEPSWEATKTRVLAANVLQSRSPNSAIRIERELRQRLQKLSDRQLAHFQRSTRDIQTQLAWLAAIKNSSFLFEFASEDLRSKMEVHDTTLRESDWERFLDEQKTHHPEIAELSSTTLGKMKRVVLAMLREVGILQSGPTLGVLHRPVLSPDFEKITREDNPKWLAAFLVTDAEIRHSPPRFS